MTLCITKLSFLSVISFFSVAATAKLLTPDQCQACRVLCDAIIQVNAHLRATCPRGVCACVCARVPVRVLSQVRVSPMLRTTGDCRPRQQRKSDLDRMERLVFWFLQQLSMSPCGLGKVTSSRVECAVAPLLQMLLPWSSYSISEKPRESIENNESVLGMAFSKRHRHTISSVRCFFGQHR